MNDFDSSNYESLNEEDFRKFVKEGYIECKKSWLCKKKYTLTQKGIDYLNVNMLDKLRYIQ